MFCDRRLRRGDAQLVRVDILVALAGADAVDVMIQLRHVVAKDGRSIHGIDMSGKVSNILTEKVIEPAIVIESAVKSATEAAVSILRIDDVLSMKPAGGPMGGMPSMGGMG